MRLLPPLPLPALVLLLPPFAGAPLHAQTVYPTGTTIWQAGATHDGYTLFPEIGGSVRLIDMDGTVVNTWNSPTSGGRLFHPKPLAGGRILVYNAASNDLRREALELDYHGNVLWSYALPASTPSSTAFHHDLERLPNGNTLLLGHQKITVPAISPIPLRDDFLLEVDPQGTIVWQWETWRHAQEFGFPATQQQQIAAQGSDWAHLNSVSVLPPNDYAEPELAAGNLLVSYRLINTVAIIDKASGRIVWKIGPGADHKTHGQHTALMIERGVPGAGRILLFDNGSGTGYSHDHPAPGASRVIEINPLTQAVVWEYGAGKGFYSDVVSGAQRLPNRNTLICSGVKGQLFEVKPSGEIVWEYMSPYFVQEGLVKDFRVYRAYRVDYDWAP